MRVVGSRGQCGLSKIAHTAAGEKSTQVNADKLFIYSLNISAENIRLNMAEEKQPHVNPHTDPLPGQ